MSALFSHNRAHFREQEQFSCSFPGCNKQYDKACRLKIHMRSHTGIHRGNLRLGEVCRRESVNGEFQFAGKTDSLEERKKDMSYLKAVKMFDSWDSRSPRDILPKSEITIDMQEIQLLACEVVRKNYHSSIPKFIDIQITV